MIDGATRSGVQRVVAHVVARERKRRTGRIGLGWTGAGIGTDTLWIDGRGTLHRSADGASLPLTTLADLAAFAGVDLTEPLDVGADTPLLGEVDTPLVLEPAAIGELVAFFGRAFAVLDRLAGGTPVTLWPEHFDVAFVWRNRANVGASPGDTWSPSPYFYVGPWGAERPGGPRRWDAPFGATLDAGGADDTEVEAFVRDRLALLGD